jgi:hypothetical protein
MSKLEEAIAKYPEAHLYSDRDGITEPHQQAEYEEILRAAKAWQTLMDKLKDEERLLDDGYVDMVVCGTDAEYDVNLVVSAYSEALHQYNDTGAGP